MNKKSILFVDDESVNLHLFRTIFFEDYEVHCVSSAEEGLEILGRREFDLIITDERMPTMTGVEFLGKVQELYPGIPPHRLLTSAYSRPDSIDLAFEKYNLNNFVTKPWNLREFKQIVADVIVA